MKSLISKCVYLFWVIPLFSSTLYSQVSITLIQPPPNQWHIEDLWNLSLFNTGETVDVYLQATVEEVTRGLVFDGNSAKFELNAGATGRIDPYSLEPVDMKYYDKELEQLLIRTNILPPGTYTICMSVMDASNQEELSKDCYTQIIIKATPPELISPANSTVLATENPVFTWLPSGINSFNNDVEYTLLVSEIVGKQTPYESINSTPYFYMEEGITGNNLLYPTDAQNFEPGKQYAWQVISYLDGTLETGKSDIWTFEGKSGNCEVIIDSIVIKCNNNLTYNIDWYIKNPVSNGREGYLNIINIQTWQPATAILQHVLNSPLQDLNIISGHQNHLNSTLSSDIPIQSLCFGIQLGFFTPECYVLDTICMNIIDCGACCNEFEASINTNSVNSIHTPSTPAVDEIVIIDNITSPNEFRQVNAEIIQYEHVIDSAGQDCCKCECNKNHRSYGTFIKSMPYESVTGELSNHISGAGWNTGGSPIRYTAGGSELVSREVVWYSHPMVDFSAGINTNLVIGVPEFNKCGCTETFKIKIRYTFTGLECKPCDKVVEYKFPRTTDTVKFLEQ